MHVNPLFPYIPAFLSFAIYGFLTGYAFILWKRSRVGCILTLIFWYAYIVWLVFILAFVNVQPSTYQLWFLAGVILPVAKMLWMNPSTQEAFWGMRTFSRAVGDAFRWTLDRLQGLGKITSRQQQQQSHSQTNHQSTYEKSYTNTNAQESMRREQAEREAEAKARRANRAGEKQADQAGNPRNDPHKQKPVVEPTRSPEEILGLKHPWTQEDLKAAYRREAGRTHPDKWIGKPESIRALMEEEYKAIQEAYRRLT